MCVVIEAKCVVQALTGPPSQESSEDSTGYSYDYLLSMPIQSLTTEKAGCGHTVTMLNLAFLDCGCFWWRVLAADLTYICSFCDYRKSMLCDLWHMVGAATCIMICKAD